MRHGERIPSVISITLSRMQKHAWQVQRGRQPLAILFLDLDGFKLINDTLGCAWDMPRVDEIPEEDQNEAQAVRA